MRKKAYWQCLMIAYGADHTGNTFLCACSNCGKPFLQRVGDPVPRICPACHSPMETEEDVNI